MGPGRVTSIRGHYLGDIPFAHDPAITEGVLMKHAPKAEANRRERRIMWTIVAFEMLERLRAQLAVQLQRARGSSRAK
jgi:hypothetical protein